ncbi:hypothetical protein GCM10010218_37100 [Streptomyces mashuensis]|uniref:ParB-like N-terminal domain-containing protein n=1 Tax=Streptomyces mashuensis TaxID=33904 RepID=A0A919EEA4_9ACTN|nr:hypothetical protein GCM10010218_37100 [Streptomyces mashuensis]
MELPEEVGRNVARLSEVRTVPLSSLLPSDSPRSGGEDAAHIRALAESDASFPPLVVMPGTLRVVDGMHRLRAAELRGATEVEVQYFLGDEKDAFVLAVEANVTHGLPLTLDDRKAAALRILGTHPLWSDRAVGSATGLSAKTVGALRARSTEGVPQSNVRIGRDGRARPLDPAEGRRLAGRLIQENPSAPLRQIAAQAGVSLGTASDVRKRLRRGEGPVPERGRRNTAGARATVEPATEEPPHPRRRDEAEANRPSRSLMLRHLSRDPSVRLTEDGRALLRWLTVVAVPGQDWERLLANVPAHRVGAVAELARGCAEVWQQVAERLEWAAADSSIPPATEVRTDVPTEVRDDAGAPRRAVAARATRRHEVSLPITPPAGPAEEAAAGECCDLLARAERRSAR